MFPVNEEYCRGTLSDNNRVDVYSFDSVSLQLIEQKLISSTLNLGSSDRRCIDSPGRRVNDVWKPLGTTKEEGTTGTTPLQDNFQID